MNGTHQFLDYAYYVNILGENLNTIQKKTPNLCYRLVGRLI